MGQIHGTLRSQAVVRKGKDLVLQTSPPPENLEFDSKQSYMVSFGIDLQTNDRFRHRSLSSIAGTDAEDMTSVFQKTIGLPSSNTCSYIASKDTPHCTYRGMQEEFIRSANKVGIDGIFIFNFTGHGLSIGQSHDWGLAPTDFDYTRDTFISGTVLTQWLHRSVFQGRYALFILDTCYSGGVGSDIVIKSAELQIPAAGIFVMTACTANETSLVITALGKSIFNYFLSTALFESYSQPGKLCLRELYDNCDACCMAFSSLLLSYDPRHDSLGWKMMQPEFMQYHLPQFLRSLFDEDEEGTDAPPTGRFAFLLHLYDYNNRVPKNPLPEKCLAWLDMVSNPNSGALFELEKRSLLNGRILTTAIAAMTYSVASLYLASQDTPSRLSSPNMFIILFLQVIASIDKIHEVQISFVDVTIALDYYMEALSKLSISPKALLKFKGRLAQEQLKAEGGEEFTDSGELEVMLRPGKRIEKKKASRKLMIKRCGKGFSMNESANPAPIIADQLDSPPLCKWVPLDPMEDTNI